MGEKLLHRIPPQSLEGRAREDQQVDRKIAGALLFPQHLTHDALDPVSLHRRAEATRNHDPEPEPPRGVGTAIDQGEVVCLPASARAEQGSNLGRSVNAGLPPPRSGGGQAYTVRRFRPLALRRFKTRRPSWVAIRFKNPWVRLRFSLLGWYVTDIVPLR